MSDDMESVIATHVERLVKQLPVSGEIRREVLLRLPAAADAYLERVSRENNIEQPLWAKAASRQ